MTDECKHERIITFRAADTNEPVGLWACAACNRKFVQLELPAQSVAICGYCGQDGHDIGSPSTPITDSLSDAEIAGVAAHPVEPSLPDADVQDEAGLLTYYSKDALAEYAQAWRDAYGVPGRPSHTVMACRAGR